MNSVLNLFLKVITKYIYFAEERYTMAAVRRSLLLGFIGMGTSKVQIYQYFNANCNSIHIFDGIDDDKIYDTILKKKS